MRRFSLMTLAAALILSFSSSALADYQWGELGLFVHESGYSYRVTSELKDPGPREFGPCGGHNLFDRNPRTCWAEGSPGPGVGEAAFIGVHKGERTIHFLNGYHKSQDLFLKNNRAGKINLSMYVGVFRMDRTTELFDAYDVTKFGPTRTVVIPDGQKEHAIPFPWDWYELEAFMAEAFDSHPASAEMGDVPDDLARKYILKFEIADAYPGSKYDDTCISEIWMSR